MKPIKISHANTFWDEPYKVVVVDIELTDEDKEMIYKYHMDCGNDSYDEEDVSMLAFIHIDLDGNVKGYHYKEQCYYPEERGEYDIDNKILLGNLEKECIEFVKKNYIGHEAEFDC